MVSAPLGRSLMPGVGGLTSLPLATPTAHFLAVAVAPKVTLANEEARTARTAKKLNQNQLVHPVAHSARE